MHLPYAYRPYEKTLRYSYTHIAAKEDMYRMRILRSELGDVQSILDAIHKEPRTTTSLGKC